MARHRGSVHEAPLRQLVCHMELLIVFLRQHIGAGRTSLVYKAPMLRGSVRVSFWPSSHTGTGPREVLRGRARSRQRVARACHTRLRFRGCGLAGKWRRWRMWTKSQSTAWRCMILWTTDSAFKQQTAQTVGHGFAILRSEDSCRVWCDVRGDHARSPLRGFLESGGLDLYLGWLGLCVQATHRAGERKFAIGY